MENKDFRQAIDRRLAGLTVSDELRRRVLEEARQQQQPAARRRVRFPLRRAAAVLVAACLTLALGISVIAAMPPFDNFIGRMGEDLRDLLQPVNLVSIQDDIRMEVAAAIHDGDDIIVYLTLQDLRSNRVDQETELENVHLDGTWFSHGEQVHFDKRTGTATFRLSGGGELDTDFDGRKTTLTVHSILSGRKDDPAVDTGYTLESIAALNPSPGLLQAPEPFSGYSLLYGDDEALNTAITGQFANQSMPILQTGEMDLAFDSQKWLRLSNAALLEDMLHVQLNPDNDMGRFNQCMLYFDYPGRQRSLAVGEVGIGEATEIGWRRFYPYQEIIMETPADVAPAQVRLMAHITTYRHYVEGNWEVSFNLEHQAEVLTADCAVDIGSSLAYRVVVSPIGVTVHTKGADDGAGTPMYLQLFLADGTEAEFPSASTYYLEDGAEHRLGLARPINVHSVDRVVLNGVEIPFHD